MDRCRCGAAVARHSKPPALAEAAHTRQEWDADAALERIKQAPLGPAEVFSFPPSYRLENQSLRRRVLRVAMRAAAVLVLAAGGVAVWNITARQSEEVTNVAMAETATLRGQRATVRLPDGTRVLLGPATTMRYAIAPTKGERLVQLDGEAQFIVVHSEKRPFVVKTRHGIATDLGTRFVVRAHAADSALTVAVSEGKVSVKRGDAAQDSVLLAAGDLGRLTANGMLSAERGVALDRYFGWTTGRLVFRDTPLAEAVAELGRWYDVDVRIANSALEQKLLTASFTNVSASEAFQLIAASLSVRVEQTNKLITIGLR